MLSSPAFAQLPPFGSFAGGAGAAVFAGLLIWLGVTLIVVFCTYWLIRLAVRHGTMDTARWQAAGSPERYSRRSR